VTIEKDVGIYTEVLVPLVDLSWGEIRHIQNQYEGRSRR
jgi:hypothetical protein